MMNISKRDLLWLIMAWAISGAASAALQVAVIAPSNRTILDLDWPSMILCMGAAMFGGVIGTLFTLHRLGEEGKKIPVPLPLQLALDMGRAVIIGLLIYGAFVVQKWEPDLLPGILTFSGMLGQKLLSPIEKRLLNAVSGNPPGTP